MGMAGVRDRRHRLPRLRNSTRSELTITYLIIYGPVAALSIAALSITARRRRRAGAAALTTNTPAPHPTTTIRTTAPPLICLTANPRRVPDDGLGDRSY